MDDQNKIIPIQSDFVTIIPKISDIKLVPEFIKFAQWSATPRQFREVKTQKEFAKLIGVSEDTLTGWKHHPQFGKFFQSFIRSWMRERIPDVIGSLYKVAAGPGAKQAGVFLRAAGLFNNKK